MRSEVRAIWFAVACGMVAFLLGLARTGSLGHAAVSGVIGFVVGGLLMQALRGRP